ncbi:MAG: hypothetical protein O2971_00475 [Proteobacteria bacterium]|nr:hypothetical protein [Pseudomonadota bacterium]
MDDITPVLIVAIVFAFVSFSVYLKYRTERLRHGVDDLESELHSENQALKNKTMELEKRIQVLESIVTTRDFQLKQEIDSLS